MTTNTAPEQPSLALWAEFLCVGGATLLLYPVFAWFPAVFGIDAAELFIGFLMFHAAHLINDPHFAVSYLLFYRDTRRQLTAQSNGASPYPSLAHVRFWLAGVVVPLVLVAWAGVAIAQGSAELLGLLIQLMFLLVGWHYVKQGFGVWSVLSARRSLRYEPFERRAVLLHCYTAWAYAWASPATPAITASEKGVVYLALKKPQWIESACLAGVVASALLLAVVLGRRIRAGRRVLWRPLMGLLISVWCWTVFSSLDPLMVYVIPALHSIQYLYFVWLLKRNEARASEGPPHFGPPVTTQLAWTFGLAVLLGWLLFHAAPSFGDELFYAASASASSNSMLGPTPYFAAIFAVVNIHHYFLDSVIWRRDNRLTQFLYAHNAAHVARQSLLTEASVHASDAPGSVGFVPK